MPPRTPMASLGMEAACGYFADVLAAEAALDAPPFASRDLEEAVRQLARAAYRAGLSEVALVKWLGIASAAALGGTPAGVALTRQLHAWAADERASASIATSRPRVA